MYYVQTVFNMFNGIQNNLSIILYFLVIIYREELAMVVDLTEARVQVCLILHYHINYVG